MSLLVLGGAVLLNSLAVALKPQVRAHGSDIRTITVSLAIGDFKFTDLRIYDSNSIERYVFAAGELVFANGTIRNNGTVTATATIVITDADTGEVLGTTYTVPNVGPGGQTIIGSYLPMLVGAMPNRNWNIMFSITP